MPDQTQNKSKNNIGDRIVPGLVTGASDDDPSGIATYSISGIQFGLSQLWLLLLATPMLIAVQSMAARIAIVTRRGLSANFASVFSRKIALSAVGLLVVANVLTIGADIAAMSEAVSILVPGTKLIHWVVPVSFIMWYVLVFFNYKQIRRYFLWLVFFFFAFVISAVKASPDWSQVLRSFVVPIISMDKSYLLAAIAVLGTTIAPYLFYWEARETIEERTPLRLARFQNWLQAPGFIMSNFVAAMIVISTATLLFNGGGNDLSAVDVARALEPVAGEYSKILFALGIIGSGFLAVPILAASSALGLSGVLGWREGLSVKPARAKGFYEVISLSILVGVQIAISGFNPLKALFFSQVITGIVTPPILILILLLANNRKIMGGYTYGWFDNIFGGLAALIMTAAAIGLLFVF